MSAIVVNRSGKKVTPFCKVCFDAGKEEILYTSHFVRSEPGPKGKVICPTLLLQECTYCHKPGHTVKFCKVLIMKKKDDARYDNRVRYENSTFEKEKVKSSKKTNKFAFLDEDSDSEIEEAEEFPQLCLPVESKSQKKIFSYAAMASKPKAIEVPEEDCISTIAVNSSPTSPKCAALSLSGGQGKVVHHATLIPKREQRSWADWSDSESEDEDF